MTGEFVRASPSVQHPLSPPVESHVSGGTTRALATCQEHPGLGILAAELCLVRRANSKRGRCFATNAAATSATAGAFS
jgi:hypothetical protein